MTFTSISQTYKQKLSRNEPELSKINLFSFYFILVDKKGPVFRNRNIVRQCSNIVEFYIIIHNRISAASSNSYSSRAQFIKTTDEGWKDKILRLDRFLESWGHAAHITYSSIYRKNMKC